MPTMPLPTLLPLLGAGYSETYDGNAGIETIPGDPDSVLITFTRRTDDGLGTLRLPVGREYSDTEIRLTPGSCARCTPSALPLRPAETLEDRDARIRLLDHYGVGTPTVGRLDDDPTVVAPGWFTERHPDPDEIPVHAEEITAGPNTGVISIARGRIIPAKITTIRQRSTVDAGAIAAPGVARFALVVGFALLWGFVSTVRHVSTIVWLVWLVVQSTLLTVIFNRLIPDYGTPPVIPKLRYKNRIDSGPAVTDEEAVAAIQKVHGEAWISATVLKNGRIVSQREIIQRFNGETHQYELEMGKTLSSDHYQLQLQTHVLAEQVRRAPGDGTGQPPFAGGTREGS